MTITEALNLHINTFTDLDVFDYNMLRVATINTLLNSFTNSYLDCTIYTANDERITSTTLNNPNVVDTPTGHDLKVAITNIMNSFNVNDGDYTLAFDYYQYRYGQLNAFFISNISSDRTELHLKHNIKTQNDNSINTKKQLTTVLVGENPINPIEIYTQETGSTLPQYSQYTTKDIADLGSAVTNINQFIPISNTIITGDTFFNTIDNKTLVSKITSPAEIALNLTFTSVISPVHLATPTFTCQVIINDVVVDELIPTIAITAISDTYTLTFKHTASLDIKIGDTVRFKIISTGVHEYLYLKLWPSSSFLFKGLVESSVGGDVKLPNGFDFYLSTVVGGRKYLKNIFIKIDGLKIRIINMYRIDSTKDFVIKLYSPLPPTVHTKVLCSIIELYFSKLQLISYKFFVEHKLTGTYLKSPNFDIKVDSSVAATHDYQTWNDILNTNLNSAQQIADSILGQNNITKLYIDYSKFENFVFYSNAYDRVQNFVYKINLLEYYNSTLTSLRKINAGDNSSNILEYAKLRGKLISGFDDFEGYLYYQNVADSLTTFNTGSIAPWPKTSEVTMNWLESYNYIIDDPSITIAASIGYNLLPISSGTVSDYLNDLLVQASDYDKQNYNALIRTIPAFIQLDTNNSQYVTFVNMAGHYYDTMYFSIKALSKVYDHSENPNTGMPDVLFQILKSFGWDATALQRTSELSKYISGTNADGTNITDFGSSYKNYSIDISKRILNNLPHIYKTKGSSRSIQALMTCYGIPNSLINIKEYGSGETNTLKTYTHRTSKFLYNLDVTSNDKSYADIPWTKINATDYPQNIQFRFIPEPTQTIYPRTLINTLSDSLYITYDASTTDEARGSIQINCKSSGTYHSASLIDVPMFNGDYTNVNISITGSIIGIYATVVHDNLLTYNSSSFVTLPNTALILSSSKLQFGQTSSLNSHKFIGKIQEVRLWSDINLSNAYLLSYAKNPLLYTKGVNEVSSYDTLIARIPFTYYNTSQFQSSIHTNQSKITFYDSQSIGMTLYTDTIIRDISGNDFVIDSEYPYLSTNINTNKVYVSDNTIYNGILSNDKSVEIQHVQPKSNNSNTIGIFISPQDMINDDIVNQLGSFNLLQYLGSTVNDNLSYYKELRDISHTYWKKYNSKNDIGKFLRLINFLDFTFFDQIKQLLPMRSTVYSGILIQPNILERTKFNIIPTVSYEKPMYEGELVLNDIMILKGIYSTLDSLIQYNNTKLAARHVYDNISYISGSGWQSTPEHSPVTGGSVLHSRTSLIFQDKYNIYSSKISASRNSPSEIQYRAAEVQDYNITSLVSNCSRFAGTKITSLGYNIPSADLPGNDPVISVTITGPKVVRPQPVIRPDIPVDNLPKTPITPVRNNVRDVSNPTDTGVFANVSDVPTVTPIYVNQTDAINLLSKAKQLLKFK